MTRRMRAARTLAAAQPPPARARRNGQRVHPVSKHYRKARQRTRPWPDLGGTCRSQAPASSWHGHMPGSRIGVIQLATVADLADGAAQAKIVATIRKRSTDGVPQSNARVEGLGRPACWTAHRPQPGSGIADRAGGAARTADQAARNDKWLCDPLAGPGTGLLRRRPTGRVTGIAVSGRGYGEHPVADR